MSMLCLQKMNYRRTFSKKLDKIQKEESVGHSDTEAIKEDSSNGLNKYFFDDDIEKFKEMESRLKDSGMLKRIGRQSIWQGKKVQLVDLCRALKEQPIVRLRIEISRLIKFMEERYQVNTGDQSKPSKYNKRPFIKTKFDYLFD